MHSTIYDALELKNWADKQVTKLLYYQTNLKMRSSPFQHI